jgi:hypothetical protein
LRRNPVIILRSLLILLATLACSVLSSTPKDTPTPEIDQAATSAAVQAKQETQDAVTQGTQDAAQATAKARQTAASIAKKSTANAAKTQAVKERATKRAADAQAATEQVLSQSTQQAADFAAVIARLYDNRVITTSEGKYTHLDDFDESWAQINWYQWWPTGLEPTNFVIRADAKWQSASESANLFNAGCGFVYAENGEDNHYVTFLAMDGNVHTYRVKSGVGTEMTGGFYGRLDTPKANAQILLAVDNSTVTVLVNNKKVVRFQDKSLDQGKLGLTLFSGTNKDYGTRCQMTNIEVWQLP